MDTAGQLRADLDARLTAELTAATWHQAAAGTYREAQHPRGPGGQWVKLDWEGIDRVVAGQFHPVQMDAQRIAHPKSGYMVEAGISRHVHHVPPGPAHGNETLGPEGPAVFDVTDHGNPLDPSYNSLAWMGGKKLGTEPIPHVYRAMTDAEWRQAKARGYIQSDQRGTISQLEGTNAAADPRDAISYLPAGRGYVAKIKVDPAEKWFTINADQYIRTRAQVPMSRVEHVVEFHRGGKYNSELRARIPEPAPHAAHAAAEAEAEAEAG